MTTKKETINCTDCPVHNTAHLVRMGVNLDTTDYVLALAGNPNTGKSTIFNNLTGLRQHTGNWPGKTVTRAEGGFQYDQKSYKIIDLPGTYSLLSTSTDEEVARDFILFGRPDVTIIVIDATRTERNLNLVLQILEITDRAVVCLNLMDEAKRKGITINVRHLSKELGVPVIATTARRREGMNELLDAISQVASGQYRCKPHRLKRHSAEVQNALKILKNELSQQFPDIPNLNWIALRMLEGDNSILNAIRTGTLGQLSNGISDDSLLD